MCTGSKAVESVEQPGMEAERNWSKKMGGRINT